MPLTQLSSDARRVSELCDLLERLADDLPQQSLPKWRKAARLSATIMPQHMDLVSRVLVERLIQSTIDDSFCQTVLRRVQSELWDCTVSIAELTNLLEDASSLRVSQLPPEALGYALRGHFDAIRRQLAWETGVLMPLALRSCSPGELEDMRLELQRHAETRVRTSSLALSPVAQRPH
ncbi:MAG: hypothetical protein AAGA15_00275 [Pseudomonadota bacterium]